MFLNGFLLHRINFKDVLPENTFFATMHLLMYTFILATGRRYNYAETQNQSLVNS
jgi:hypothetical protein